MFGRLCLTIDIGYAGIIAGYWTGAIIIVGCAPTFKIKGRQEDIVVGEAKITSG